MRVRQWNRPRLFVAILATLLVVALVGLTGCSGGGDEATGADFSSPAHVQKASFNPSKATGQDGAKIDVSSVSEGYVAAKATGQGKLKLQIICGDASQNYDLPSNGTPLIAALPFGEGSYTFRIMKNTSGNNYVELYRTQKNVTFDNEFSPFVRPNTFCQFDDDSSCVKQAKSLVKDAENEGEALKAVCTWIVDNVAYDNGKAEKLKNATGYVPNPDAALKSKKGICFDYASLGAAMLRSQGIPTKIRTGYVSPDNIYHAWIEVNIDGTWKSAQFSVDKRTWSRVDLTFAAGSGNSLVGDGKDYTDRYTY